MVKTFSFVDQLEKGESAEKVLDIYFSKWYTIYPVNMDMQRKGIDRLFERRQLSDDPMLEKDIIKIEYKSDSRTQDTGNCFVETKSVMELGKLGWAYTSQADILVYFAEPDTLYIVRPEAIREKVDEWVRKFGERPVRNKNYHTIGVPVPERVFETICESVRRLN